MKLIEYIKSIDVSKIKNNFLKAAEYLCQADFFYYALFMLVVLGGITIFFICSVNNKKIKFEWIIIRLYLFSSLLLALCGFLKWYFLGRDNALFLECCILSSGVFIALTVLYAGIYSLAKLFSSNSKKCEFFYDSKLAPQYNRIKEIPIIEGKLFNVPQTVKIKAQKLSPPRRTDDEINYSFIISELNKINEAQLDFSQKEKKEELLKLLNERGEIAFERRQKLSDAFLFLVKAASESAV